MKSRTWRAAVRSAWAGAAAFFVGCQVATPPVASRPPATALPVAAAAIITPVAAQPARLASVDESAFSVPIVELRGSGDDLGAAHGRRLGPTIRLLHEAYLKRFISGATERFLALTAARGFASLAPDEYRREVVALADASGIAAPEAMLGQCFLDLLPMTACSTVALPAEASPDGVPRLGRNLDFPSFDVADRYSTLFVYHPSGKYAFASVGWPGLIGVLSGMNEHGLTIANMEVTRGPRLPHAMPYTMLYRTVLEQCRTTQEAIDLLQRTPRQTSNNLMIMDAAGDRAVAEISPDGVTVRRSDAVALISTNHRRGADDHATPGRCWRYDALRQASEHDFGSIGVERIEQMLAASSQDDETLQSMVFEPSTRVLYLSAGKDAARGTFHRIELGPYLRH